MSAESQLDLFAGGTLPNPASDANPVEPAPPVQDLHNAALIAGIPGATNHRARQFAEEAARRHLPEAVPALEALCRRFKGFGQEHPVGEQTSALSALVELGGRGAAYALTRMIHDGVFGLPGLPGAVSAGRRLGVHLSPGVSADLLRHADPAVRTDAAYCCTSSPAVTAILVDLLGDLHPPVALAAACALGRMRRPEGRPILLRALATDPTVEVIEAAAAVADGTIIVLLGRIAQSGTGLRDEALAALRDIDDERAVTLVARLE
jgi:HEAT repeat protein